MTKTERRLYKPIIDALKEKFAQWDICHFEDTSRKFSETLKGQLDDYSLFILNVERMSPDVTGFAIKKSGNWKSIEIIVVEIKEKRPTLKDIYQTKRYAEILKASYGLLVSPKKLSMERRKFLIKRMGEITQFHPNKNILICQFNESSNSILVDKELYYDGQIPEIFK